MLGSLRHEAATFDDNQINVEAARAMGLTAHRAVGVEQACAMLVAHDLIAR